jgi:EAL domain-containing protein (putative c-di-GMP-specific phosphodiesterase class I)
MYASKREAAGRPVMATTGGGEPEMVRTSSVVDRAEALRRAMEAGELDVHFQPVHRSSGELLGFEALLRWHRDGRLVPAADFIEAAEATGLICEVGPWVVDEVCRRAVASRRTDLTWFVNLSPRELAAPRTIGAVHDALDRHGLPASSLVVEVTEHASLAEGGVASGVVAELAAMGVVAAIDDFGSGWSSLSSLLAVPAGWLKIDRRFVGAVGTPQGEAIVAAVIDLARRLGIRTIAEGVEDDAQLSVLRALGVDCLQGYLLGRPAPLDDLLLPAR